MLVKKFDKLYTLDKSGNIRNYLVEVGYDSSNEILPRLFYITSYTGLWNGKETIVNKKANKGRQGRTDEQQAIFEAQSQWNTKRNEGYKSLIDLSLKAQSMELDVALDRPIPEVFRSLEIKYNTDTNWYALPMLAEKYPVYKKKLVYPQIYQPKLNGVRSTCFLDQDKLAVVFASRGGQTYNIPHLQAQLHKFFEVTDNNLILDGEIYCHGKRLQEIYGAASLENDSPEWLEYHLYDILSPKPLPQRKRLNDLRILHTLLINQFGATHIKLVHSGDVANEEETKLRHDECVEQGYEGLILRNPDTFYQISFRDKCLLKVKEFEDEEFEIISCHIDTNIGIGESFVFELQNNINELTFKARPMGTIDEKTYWYHNQHIWRGKIATVRFQERTKDGIPHQGHVRKDKSRCLIIENIDRKDI